MCLRSDLKKCCFCIELEDGAFILGILGFLLSTGFFAVSFMETCWSDSVTLLVRIVTVSNFFSSILFSVGVITVNNLRIRLNKLNK